MGWSITVEGWIRREALLVSFLGLMAAAAALFAALGWTGASIGAIALGLAGGLVRLLLRLRQSKIEGDREQAQLDRRVRVPIGPVKGIRPIEIGVDPAAQDALPGGEIPEYLPRTVDADVGDALTHALAGGEPWIVAVCGPSKVGKSRTLFEGIRRCEAEGQELRLVTPVDGSALLSLLEPGQNPETTGPPLVVWIDDLEVFVAEGASFDTLREWHERDGVIFAATYGGKGSERIGDSGTTELTALTENVLLHAAEISLDATSSIELDQLPKTVSAPDRSMIEEYGLAAAMVAAPALQRKLTTARHAPGEAECFEGVAVVRAAIDWARCGRTDPISTNRLRELWPNYLPVGVGATDAAFEVGLAWAVRPVAGRIALLFQTHSYLPYDYVVRFVSDRPDSQAPLDAAWDCALDTSDPRQAFDVGVSAFNHQDHDRAMAGMQIARLDDSAPIAAIANFNIGVLLQKRDDLEGAAAAYRAAIALNSGIAASNLGLLLRERGDLDGARAALEQAIELKSGEGAFNLGVLNEREGRIPEAEAAYREGVELGEGQAASNLGLLLEEGGDLEGAEAAYRRAIELGTEGGTSNLGLMARKQDDPKGAEAAWRLGVEMGHGKSALNLGLLMSEQGRLDDAEVAFREALELGVAAAGFKLGVLLVEERNDSEGAEAAWEAAAELGDGDGASAIGVLRQKRGDLAGAEVAYRHALEMGHGGGASNLGILLAKRGETAGAESALRAAADLGDGGGAFNLGLLLRQKGDDEGAHRAFTLALETRDPRVVEPARAALAELS